MFRLIRSFAKKEWADQFLSGEIYMNSLKYFWDSGNSVQRDVAEGACESINPSFLKDYMPSDLIKNQVYEAQILPIGSAFCNICCFSRQLLYLQDNGSYRIVSDSLTKNLGKWSVVIDDFPAFIDKLDVISGIRQLRYVAGPVEYYDPAPITPGPIWRPSITLRANMLIDLDSISKKRRLENYRDAFTKNSRYKWQREWRIAVYTGKNDGEHYVLRLGNLSKIAHIVSTDSLQEIDKSSQRWIDEGKCWGLDGYFGNTSRKQFREFLNDLGNRKGILLSHIG